MSRSTELSGGEGFTYEDTVAAYFLTELLHEGSAAGVAGRVTRVAVQQASQGEPLDDLIVDAELVGELRRLSLQVKRQLTISKADADFKELIASALKTRGKPSFRRGIDRYGFIARSVGTDRLNSLLRVVAWAQASTSGTEFAARFLNGEASQSDIRLREELQTLIQAGDPDSECDFYAHFFAQRMDGLSVGEDRYVAMANRLGQLTASGPQDGAVLAEALCRQVRTGEGKAKVWTRASLLNELRTFIRLKVAPSYANDIEALKHLAQSSALEIRADIGGSIIERKTLVDEAQNKSSAYRLTNISGLPGCGKSVVLRRLVERALAAGPVLFLTSDRIDATSWLSFATSIGLSHRKPLELLSEVGAVGTPVLFLDGIDRIKPANRGVVTDLLHAIEENSSLSHWHVVASSRDQGLEAFRQWIPASFYQRTGIGSVGVELLNDEEATLLAKEKSHLKRLLFGTPAVREIARRPFFAAVLADQFAEGEEQNDAPQTEIELIAAWWRAGGYNAADDAVLARQRALIDLAEAGATSLGKAIAARQVAASTLTQVQELKRDRIIEVVEEGSMFSFAHDIFFEWAFFRLLIDKGAVWHEAMSAAGEPPLLARVVGLLSQRAFEAGGNGWASEFQRLTESGLRPQWRRAWLLAPAESTRFFDHIEIFQSLLLAGDAALLVKFLVWFQAERTIPNPVILHRPHSGIQGAALIRAADALGWPTDLALWTRVLSWILAREATLPVVSVPHVVELFAVFQNMLGDYPNATSKRLIQVSEAWLLDLERPVVFVNGIPPAPTRWGALPRGGRGVLEASLRQLILRSGRAYPEAARAIVLRATHAEDRSEDLFGSIVIFSPILAQVCPTELAELVRAEVFEQLPLEEREDRRKRRNDHLELLRSIRAKPENERSDWERKLLSHPVHIQDEPRYDFDDIGINRHHRSFFSPSPLTQPFASLLELAQEAGLQLIRDIGNRAAEGWKQVCQITGYGKPIPLEVTFPWGTQRFFGDAKTYAWFLGVGGPQPLEAAFLALTYWAHKRIDAGDDVDQLIQKIVQGHESWTVLGLAASLALQTTLVSETVLALVTTQRLWDVDLSRQIQVPDRGLPLLGFDVRDQMTPDQRQAGDYLSGRRFRSSSIRDLVPNFALGPDVSLRASLKAALRRFPDELPFLFEEQAANENARQQLLELAREWARWGDAQHYRVEKVPEQPNVAAVHFESPEPPSEELKQKSEEAGRRVGDYNIVRWAQASLQNRSLDPRYNLEAVLAFARMRDMPDLLRQVADAEDGSRQAGVAAAAAVAAVFADEPADVSWAWSVLDRVRHIEEESSGYAHSQNPLDPRSFLIAALFHTLRTRGIRQNLIEQLLTLAANDNSHIAVNALTALLGLPEPARVKWVAAAMASELFILHTPDMEEEDGERHRAQRLYRAEVLERAIARTKDGSVVPLAPPPDAWIFAPVRRMAWDEVDPPPTWRLPELDFNTTLATAVTRLFPVEAWSKSSDERSTFLEWLQQLVRWTNDRLFPFWEQAEERHRRSSQLLEWHMALADLIARTSAFLPANETIERFIAPISHHQHEDALRFVASVTSALVCRGVYDAPAVADDTLVVIRHCMDRMLAEREFNPSGYRAGEVHGEMRDMIRALLLVSVKDAPGAARFANGMWGDLLRVVALIDVLMERAGWSAFVMDTYLQMCERADSALPIDVFTRHVIRNIEAQHDKPLAWRESIIPARIAGVVQRLAETNYPLTSARATDLLEILDRLVDMGDRRSAALQQSEYFRGVQLAQRRRSV